MHKAGWLRLPGHFHEGGDINVYCKAVAVFQERKQHKETF